MLLKERDKSIDIAKGIGIFLMVMGHTTSNRIVLQWIYSFHMPLFFFLSGIFHSQGESYIYFFKKKVRTLLIPYFFFSIILFLFFLIVSKNIGFSAGENLSVKENFIGILLGNEVKGLSQMSWRGQLWFIPALFLVENIYYYFCKFNEKIRVVLVICCLVLNIIVSKVISFNIPWSWLTVLVAINFYAFGHLLRDIINKKQNMNSGYIYIFLLINIISNYFNNSVEMYSNIYGNIFLFLLSAYSGIIFIILFIKSFIKKSEIFEYIGKNSLVVLVFHKRAITIIKVLFIVIFQIDIIKENILYDLCCVICEIILCIPAIIILNKYFPFFIGKKIKN